MSDSAAPQPWQWCDVAAAGAAEIPAEGFEPLLLRFLRGTEEPSPLSQAAQSASAMLSTLTTALGAQAQSGDQSSFWRITAGWFELLAEGLLPFDQQTRRLGAKLWSAWKEQGKGKFAPPAELAEQILQSCQPLAQLEMREQLPRFTAVRDAYQGFFGVEGASALPMPEEGMAQLALADAQSFAAPDPLKDSAPPVAPPVTPTATPPSSDSNNAGGNGAADTQPPGAGQATPGTGNVFQISGKSQQFKLAEDADVVLVKVPDVISNIANSRWAHIKDAFQLGDAERPFSIAQHKADKADLQHWQEVLNSIRLVDEEKR